MPETADSPRIVPVILSGGSGSRLWPMSRELYPKQLQPLVGERTMLQDTALRVADPGRFRAPLVVCNEAHRFVVAEQLRAAGVEPADILLEPEARNTAAAVAVAAARALEDGDPALILVLAADQLIREVEGFLAAVDAAADAARAGRLVSLGVRPTEPHTGYGWIRVGADLGGGASVVDRFVEKPKRDAAEAMLADGRHLWNGGIFVFDARQYLEELERHEPRIAAASRAAVAAARRDADFLRLDRAAFADQPSVAVDVAVMERTDRAAVVPMSCTWSDVGNWGALYDVGDHDADGNVVLGDAALHDVRRSYVRSDGLLTAVVGLEDVVVVATDDAVLVADRRRVQDVKAVVERLKADGRPEASAHSRVYRPWGYYQTLHGGDRFQVKRLTVHPGRQLSLQRHFHRAEHWVVVNGTALVTRGEEKILLGENESVYLPLGAVHRLANPGKVPLNLIEVQVGPYLGEDDIVRYDETLEVGPGDKG